MTSIYLVRHCSVGKCTTMIGQTDIPLSEAGYHEASELAVFFAARPVESVWCSPMKRAHETARIIAEGCAGSQKSFASRLLIDGTAPPGLALPLDLTVRPFSSSGLCTSVGFTGEGAQGSLPVRVLPALAEICLGEWEGMSSEQIRQMYPNHWEERGNNFASVAPPGGESFQDLADRVLPLFMSLCRGLAEQKAAVIVAHQAVNRAILAHYTGVPLDEVFILAQPYGAINRLDYTGEDIIVRSINQRADEKIVI